MSTIVRVQLKVLGQLIQAEVPTPPATVRLDAVLPLLQQLDDEAVRLAVDKMETETGERVTCAKGCSACCRAQPVPVTPVEAYALWRLVEELPEPRRTLIRQRFAASLASLQEAGLLEMYLQRPQIIQQEEALAMARRYFSLGLPCPFLDDDACGIYGSRPFVCRQYLVTTPVERCNNPLESDVHGVPMPIRFAHAMLDTSEKFLKNPQATIPLVLALEYVNRHREELEQAVPAEALFRTAIANLAPIPPTTTTV